MFDRLHLLLVIFCLVLSTSTILLAIKLRRATQSRAQVSKCASPEEAKDILDKLVQSTKQLVKKLPDGRFKPCNVCGASVLDQEHAAEKYEITG